MTQGRELLSDWKRLHKRQHIFLVKKDAHLLRIFSQLKKNLNINSSEIMMKLGYKAEKM
jgi:hypothetical protein